jgi:transcription elongation factor Elf1
LGLREVLFITEILLELEISRKRGEIMDEKTVFKVGDRIDQMCLTCNEERGHVVVSVSKTGNITRVGCPMCGSRVAYRAGATRRASSKVVAPYDRARTYRKGQILMHPMFGEGEVTAIIEPQKMDVLFADRMRRLIHEHS